MGQDSMAAEQGRQWCGGKKPTRRRPEWSQHGRPTTPSTNRPVSAPPRKKQRGLGAELCALYRALKHFEEEGARARLHHLRFGNCERPSRQGNASQWQPRKSVHGISDTNERPWPAAITNSSRGMQLRGPTYSTRSIRSHRTGAGGAAATYPKHDTTHWLSVNAWASAGQYGRQLERPADGSIPRALRIRTLFEKSWQRKRF